MRIITIILLAFVSLHASGQFPYVKKLNYPDQLPTQVVYDMLTDSKGYIWLGTDKGLFRFNGRTFVAIPFDNTSSKAVSYLQEDIHGTIWCMNFYNQLFSLQKDSLRMFVIDYSTIKESPTFNNVIVGDREIFFHSFKSIYVFGEKDHKLSHVINAPGLFDHIIASTFFQKKYYAFSNDGNLYRHNGQASKWAYSGHRYTDFRFVNNQETLLGLGIGLVRKPLFELTNADVKELPAINLSPDVYIFQGTSVDKEDVWLCTQSGAYRWNKTTGETHCYLPNERVTDVVKDYQGNYWFSTLDNGIFVCASLYNTLLKVYNDPLMDNFTKLATLPSGELMVGNSQGLIAKVNIENGKSLRYKLVKSRETEFIYYDTVTKLIICNRGVLDPNKQRPIEVLDYSKGVIRDPYGNFILVVFNGVYIFNDHFNTTKRLPKTSCPLYEKLRYDTVSYDGNHQSLQLRPKRGLAALASFNKECFWVAYQDGLYAYYYNGNIVQLKDAEGQPVIAKSLQQQNDGSLIAGTATKGVIIFKEGKPVNNFTAKDGLSSINVRKLLKDGNDTWVLTDEGLDRICGNTYTITNYMEEYGLTNIIINDFILAGTKIIFATTTGILVKDNLPRFYNFEIKFPYLHAMSNGVEVEDKKVLPAYNTDISFRFEALHYLSSNSLTYAYRLKEIDTVWRFAGSFVNQLSFNRLSPGKYHFEIKALGGPNYQSVVRSFAFEVPRPFWRKVTFFLLLLGIAVLLLWLSLRQWKKTLLKKQFIKEELLKSQLVALRAQMNPHFLYNVLNTVQGLVYGNRKTEAGELLGNFSDLMRKTLQASDKQLLALRDEIENIRLYLELEKARFDKGFSYELIIENITDLSAIYVPSLMLQPFVENAVKHGLMHKQGEKKITIRFEKQGGGLRVTIDDNGIGRTHSAEINRRSKSKPFSFATVALNERMDLFNRLYKDKIICHVIDKSDSNQAPSGTLVELFIPDYNKDPDAL